MSDVGHSHGHAHDADLGDWRDWADHPTLRWVLVAVAAAFVATVVGVVALWPDGSGRDAAIEQAREVGLGSERLGATVQRVSDGPCSYSTPDNPQDCRQIDVIPSEGIDEGAVLSLGEFNLGELGFAPEVSVGDRIVLGFEPSTDFYFYADRERRSTLLWLAIAFAVVVVALGRIRGLLALLSMVVTLVVLIAFVAPSVLDGNDPLLVSVVAASAIAFVGLYLTHGFDTTTTMALAGTLGALVLTLAVAWWFFDLAAFTGLATEEGLTLPIIAEDVELSSLLLGGAVIGALGALDDVTVTQVATVAELRRRRPDLTTTQLIASGIRVGREHIASTVNTLLLAYAGAAMPLLLLFAVSNQSLSTVANSELVAVEIARTLCGSIGLVAAVPITTLLAALLLGSTTPRAEVAPDVDSDAPEPESSEVADPPPTSWDDFAPDEEPTGF